MRLAVTHWQAKRLREEDYREALRLTRSTAMSRILCGAKPVSRPAPIPPSAQRTHSQGGRTLAPGRPARQGPARAGTDWETVTAPGSAVHRHNAGSAGVLTLGPRTDRRDSGRSPRISGGRCERRACAVRRRPRGPSSPTSPVHPVEAARSEEAGGGADLPQPPRHVRRPPLARISPSAGRPGLPRPRGPATSSSERPSRPCRARACSRGAPSPPARCPGFRACCGFR